MSYSTSIPSIDQGAKVFINLKSDYGFKRLFSNPQHLGILLDLLNSIFKGVKVIKSVSLRPTEIIPKNEESRKSVVDINCVGDNDETFIVEMQLAAQEFYKDRTILYASEVISGSVPKGEAGDTYEMKEFYIISFMNFILYPKHPNLYLHDVTLHHNLLKEPFFDKIWFKYIELPKFVNKGPLDSDLEKWLNLLVNLENMTEPPAGYEKPIFQEAFGLAEYSKLTKEEQMAYQSSINSLRDYNATLSYAEKRGLEKGLEKGRRLEREIAEKEIATFQAKAEQNAYADKLESARKMKKAGLSLAQISDFTSLPLDIVEKL
ncbi:conserved hypothetical protein (putative transposase or invertase) [bacterium A37T11]|nr:conserved hypothetical protein (putative transposase or invertase) [bacterium A37T11]SEO20827.1 conserved hypothetical protein (putative transposase or invertase) [bacterium A37T11]